MRAPLLCLLLLLWLGSPVPGGQQQVLKIGLLCSQTGTMASSEAGVLRASLLAVQEINALGGISLGEERSYQLEPVIRDGASDPATFARQARELCSEGVQFFFGCWTSDSRQAVRDVLQSRGGLLFYPIQFEGRETSRAVVYSGLTANQQLFPALDYLLAHGARRFYLVGSDYLYPHVSNDLARAYLARHGAQVVAEKYRPRGSQDWSEVVSAIRDSGCDAVLNTINGDSLDAFFKEYRLQSARPPVMCLSLGESQALALGSLVSGHYTCWGYYMNLENATNSRFIQAYRDRYGADAVVDDAAATAYFQMHAFALAAHRVNRLQAPALRKALEAMIVDTPGGLVRYDPKNLYAWRTVRIAQADDQGRMHIVWSSELPRKPEPWSR